MTQTPEPPAPDGAPAEIGTPALDGDRVDEGGDDACWLHLVCDECGAVVSDGHRPGCREGGDRR